MNQSVHNSSDRKDATNNCTNVDQELYDVFPRVRVTHSNWGYLIIKDDDVLLVCSLLVLLMDLKLEYFSCEPVSKTEVRLKDRGHRLDGKHGPHSSLGDFSCIADFLKTIERVLNIGVWESPFNAFELLLCAEGEMVDFERIVQADTLLGQ